jgi:hypothetical protein
VALAHSQMRMERDASFAPRERFLMEMVSARLALPVQFLLLLGR